MLKFGGRELPNSVVLLPWTTNPHGLSQDAGNVLLGPAPYTSSSMLEVKPLTVVEFVVVVEEVVKVALDGVDVAETVTLVTLEVWSVPISLGDDAFNSKRPVATTATTKVETNTSEADWMPYLWRSGGQSIVLQAKA